MLYSDLPSDLGLLIEMPIRCYVSDHKGPGNIELLRHIFFIAMPLEQTPTKTSLKMSIVVFDCDPELLSFFPDRGV